MKISVAVPSLNYGYFIGKCLSSILMQEYSEYEVLICDGGSEDGTLQVIADFVSSDERFRIVSRNDNGQADAINKAFAVAKGDIFCYLNADDYLLATDVFQEVVDAFRAYPDADVLCFRSWYVNEGGKTVKPVFSRYHPLDNLSWIPYRGQVVQPSAFWRRRVYDTYKFDHTLHYCFDSKFFYEAFHTFSFLEFGKPVAAYRIHDSNKSVGVSWRRIMELSRFEGYKFGHRSGRSSYLRFIAVVVRSCGAIPMCGEKLQRGIYCLVNGLSLLTFHRLPGI